MRTEFIKLYGYIYDITVPYDIMQYYTVLYYIILYCINYIILYPIIPNILAILIFYLRVSKLLQAGNWIPSKCEGTGKMAKNHDNNNNKP